MVERVSAPLPPELERRVTERVTQRLPPIERRHGSVMLVPPGCGRTAHKKVTRGQCGVLDIDFAP